MSGVPLVVKQRAKFEYEFFVNDGLRPPSAIDISNRSYRAQMRESASGPLIAEFVFIKSDQTQASTKGQILMTLSAAKTASIPCGSYVYDVFQTVGSDDPTVLFYGTVEVYAAVTR